MNKQQLISEIKRKKSVLCVGLDTDITKIPAHLLGDEDPVFAFNKAIIDATAEFAVAYKPNTAFYESRGLAGWASLEKTIKYLNTNYPELFTIADAKRGEFASIADDAVDDRLDIGAVVADEHHQEPVRSPATGQRVPLPVGPGQVEVHCRQSEVADGRVQ